MLNLRDPYILENTDTLYENIVIPKPYTYVYRSSSDTIIIEDYELPIVPRSLNYIRISGVI